VTSPIAAHDLPVLASARSVPALLSVVALLVSILALAPPAAAVDEPTPDPSLDVRPDPQPVHSHTAPADQPATPVQEKAAPTERSSTTRTQVTLAAPNRTAQPTSGQPPTTRSRPLSASRPRTSAAARATRPHERARRNDHASAIATLRRLSSMLAAPRLLRPAATSRSSGSDSGAEALLFAGLALLLLVAASGSLLRLTTRISADFNRERAP
jgi:hypothetical protein